MHKPSLFAFAALLTLVGGGCFGKSTPVNQPEGPAGPKPATFEALTPADAAKKINLTKGSVIVMTQSFSGSGKAIAEKLGWGETLSRDVIIRRFAPKVHAELEWKITTEGATGTKQYAGAVLGGDLQNSPDAFLPSFWLEGERDALSGSIVWLSSDTYENLARSKSGTFRINLDNVPSEPFLNVDPYLKGINALQAEVKKVIGRKDVYLATAGDVTTMSLKINGKDVDVEVLPIQSWFGAFTVLNNPQNPLILEYKSTLPEKTLDGFLDFKVTEIREIQE